MVKFLLYDIRCPTNPPDPISPTGQCKEISLGYNYLKCSLKAELPPD